MRFLDQECEAVALLCQDRLANVGEISFERCAIAWLAVAKKPLRARRIIKIENGCLRESIGRPAAGGMQRIALELNRTSIDGRRDERNGARSTRHRSRIVEKFSGNRPLRAFRKRHEMRFRAAATIQAKTRQGHRCAHQFQKAAS